MSKWILPVLSAVLLFKYTVPQEMFRSGYVEKENYYFDTRFICSSLKKIAYNVMSILQCLHRCARRDHCGVANYREGNDGGTYSKNCEIFEMQRTHESCRSSKEKGWIGFLPEVRNSGHKCSG